MMDNPLLKIQDFGQSIWLDFISRQILTSGKLGRLISEDGIRGVTSNPKIFDDAISGSNDYDEEIDSLARAGKTREEIYRASTVKDIQSAADLFRPQFEASGGVHGFVSLEVNPHLAGDADGTIAEARELWAALDRPNVFIKVPATLEGLAAIRRLISDGINVNVTLLFGLNRYRDVAEAYIAGLEDRLARNEPISRVASVASFFLSRIDVLIDPMLKKLEAENGPHSEKAGALYGEIAIACARLAYQIYKELFGTDRFRRLIARGARTQRVLWASTSTKNPDFHDLKYAEALIGPDTVNTLPAETVAAYRDHGNPQSRLGEGLDEAKRVLRTLSTLGIDLDSATLRLEEEGVEKFIKPYDALLDTLEEKRKAALRS